MLDRYAQMAIRPVIQALATGLHRAGVRATTLTWLAWAVGMASAVAIAMQAYITGLLLLLLSRLLDGLDGAVARLGTPSDAGGFLDISLDFWFYAAIPLAFAWADSEANALPAAFLLAAFIGTGTSFLAYAVMREKQNKHEHEHQPAQTAYQDNGSAARKSFYFLGGLTEATETIGFFLAMCLWPQHFATLAVVFAMLCLITSATRINSGLRDL